MQQHVVVGGAGKEKEHFLRITVGLPLTLSLIELQSETRTCVHLLVYTDVCHKVLMDFVVLCEGLWFI